MLKRTGGAPAPGEGSRRIDTFIFDLDGTLLDTLPDLIQLTNRALREQGFPEHDERAIRSFIGNGAAMLIRRAVPPDTPEEQVDATMLRWRELYPECGIELTRPYPHMMETLRRLKEGGAHLAVLSNKFDKGVTDVIGAFMPGIFEVMHGESDLIPRKPDPTGLLYTMEELGADPVRTVYVGDSQADMWTARAAGVLAVGALWGYGECEGLDEADCDLTVDDPLDLLELAE